MEGKRTTGGAADPTFTNSLSAGGDFGHLSDEVILMILNLLSPKDLYNLMKTCVRLNNLCQEPKLWTSIEDPPDKRESIHFALNHLMTSKTKKVKLSVGCSPINRGYRTSLSPSSLKLLLQGDHLSELHLVNQRLDADHFRMHDLPPNLRVLNMSGCVLSNYETQDHGLYLKDLSLRLKELEDLNLSYCSFAMAHSLMPISKLPKLKKLYLRGCRDVGECLAYVALSTRYGFTQLKVLDVTDTRVGSIEFSSFAIIKTLEEFYFGQYDQFLDHPINHITDLCITRIRNSPTIRILDASGSRLTDRSLEIFESIPNLERVEAHFTSFSKNALETFHRNRPKCRIHMVENPVQVSHVLIRPQQLNTTCFNRHHGPSESPSPSGSVITIDTRANLNASSSGNNYNNTDNNNHNV